MREYDGSQPKNTIVSNTKTENILCITHMAAKNIPTDNNRIGIVGTRHFVTISSLMAELLSQITGIRSSSVAWGPNW